MAKWIYLQNRTDTEMASKGKGKISSSLLKILSERGISEEGADDFLSPYPKLTYDPFLLPDLKEAVLRIIGAVKKRGLPRKGIKTAKNSKHSASP